MTCILCGCSEFRPCIGGVLFPAANVHRMVDDEELLAAGEACHWVDPEICSAHSPEEIATVGLEVLCRREGLPVDGDLA